MPAAIPPLPPPGGPTRRNLVIEPFDAARVRPGAYVALPGKPYALVVEVMAGAWTTPTVRVWLDYGTHIGLYSTSRSAPVFGEPTAKMILPGSRCLESCVLLHMG